MPPDNLSNGATEAAMAALGASEEPAVEERAPVEPQAVEDDAAAGLDLEQMESEAAEAAASVLGDEDLTMVKVNGREVPMTREQLITHAQLGYDHTQRNRELKEREAAMQKHVDDAKQYQALIESLQSSAGTVQVLEMMFDPSAPGGADRQRALRQWASQKGMIGSPRDEDPEYDDDEEEDSMGGGKVSGELAALRAQVSEMERRERERMSRQQAETMQSKLESAMDGHAKFFPKGSRARSVAGQRIQSYLAQNAGASVEQAVGYALSERVEDLREAAALKQAEQRESQELRTLTAGGSVPGATTPHEPPKAKLKSKAMGEHLTNAALSLLDDLR